ncbi:hypothetical protein NM688_g7771 [Phlebia brevispora]|uniref:Uncharacterized protein n=1 Tax=Phlebia brevispora TaxID=194682 RepID=A0ACC1S1B2_9APHY|nr:hypothetical protein NM688_g7771 [Phlebia brevispora]
MSSNATDSAIIASYDADLVYNYSVCAALTLVCYEIMVTLQYEYEFIWHRKWTASTWLFLSNRCSNLALLFFLNIVSELPAFILTSFSALRVFALLDRAYSTATVVFLLGITPIAVEFYQQSRVTSEYVDDPVLGSSCYFNFSASPAVALYTDYPKLFVRKG